MYANNNEHAFAECMAENFVQNEQCLWNWMKWLQGEYTESNSVNHWAMEWRHKHVQALYINLCVTSTNWHTTL